MNLANRITIARVIMIPVFLVVLMGNVFGEPASGYAAAAIFAVASLSDLLDGYIARSRNMVTNFGKFMDPLADKLLVSAALIALVEMGRFPAWAAIVIVSREFIVTGFRLVAVEGGLVIAAGFTAKIKTTLQMIMVVFILLNLSGTAVLTIQWVLIWLAVAFTILSAVEYIVKNRNVLKQK